MQVHLWATVVQGTVVDWVPQKDVGSLNSVRLYWGLRMVRLLLLVVV